MKGFVTVATGKEQYYILAYNLLQSYRFHTKSSTPFAILCEEHNEWTKDFDDVILIDQPARSYIDKLSILDLSPYDETIFIDADSLVYRDLDDLWSLFQNGPDLGLLGCTYSLEENAWWSNECLGALKELVEFKVTAAGGLYYVRNNGKDLPAIMETIRYIEEHYMEFHFYIFEKILEDETILSLAASVHHIRPVCHWDEIYAFYPLVRCVSANIRTGRLRYIWESGSGKPRTNGRFIHFGTLNTLGRQSDGLYYREVFRLKYHPDRRKDWKDRISLFLRRLTNLSRIFLALAQLFPKELRNKYNKVESRGREHICWGDPDSYE